MFSFRDAKHRWDPKNQRPELWSLYNGRVNKGESIRVFPLSNWTELDIWQYIHPLTGAVESTADTLPQIIQEMLLATNSEREGRVIDYDGQGSMEEKKREGYF